MTRVWHITKLTKLIKHINKISRVFVHITEFYWFYYLDQIIDVDEAGSNQVDKRKMM
jgi:hypothetical protein